MRMPLSPNAPVLLLGASLLGGAAFLAPGCSSSSPSTSPVAADGGHPADASTGGITLALACTDSIASVYADPGPLPTARGAILRCAHDQDFTRAQLEALARQNGYAGRAFTSGARAYRVLYRTSRGDAAGSPGYSSASVLIPDTPRAASLPVVVAAHGLFGDGPCAASKSNLSPQPKDVVTVLLTGIAGGGYAVIMPDYAGYSNYGAPGNPPSGIMLAADVGKSVLDGARALRNLMPAAVSNKIALVGHSEGGHGVLSALSMADAYGADGTIVGVATYSPQWFSEQSWGAMLALPQSFPLQPPDGGSAYPIEVGIWYHYSHGELLDGPGHGVDVFAASKRDAVKQFVETTCAGGTNGYPALSADGGTIADLYDPGFTGSIGFPSAGFGDCTAGDTVCTTWMARYAADRPHLTGGAAKTPLLIVYGGQDTTIPPERAICGFDRLKSDGAAFHFCYEPTADHSGGVAMRSDYVGDWIGSLALGERAPVACATDYSVLATDAGPVQCATPPPND